MGVLAAVLLAWAAVFALGAYLQPGGDHFQRDIRRPVIILSVMLGFLALWGLALWVRARRGRK